MEILEELQLIYPNHLCLPLSEKDCERAWNQSQIYSNNTARWNAYLNRLTLRALMDAWREEDSELPEVPKIWLNEPLTALLWEFVNGSIMIVNDRRIALIPSMTLDTEAFYVQREWVDIPELVASYYIPIQILPEDGVLRAWGFTTHAQLKKAGEYNASDRTYVLDRDRVIDDLCALWVSLELCPEPVPELVPLSKLSATEAEEMLNVLGQKTEELPRLQMPFEKWAAFLANQNLRQRLYELRVKSAKLSLSQESKPIHLSQWFLNVATEAWQTLEMLSSNYQQIALMGSPSLDPALQLRSGSDTVKDLIQQINNTLDRPGKEESCRSAIRVLGEMGADSEEAIELLSEVATTAKDQDTRWTAAFSLEKLAPNHPAANVRRAKVIKLEMQFSPRKVMMMVALMPRVDDKVGVWIQVRSADNRPELPPGLSLSVSLESGKTRSAPSTENRQESHDIIQLRFQGKPGTQFQAIVALNEVKVVEDYFLI